MSDATNTTPDRRSPSWPVGLGVQVLLVGSLAVAYAALPGPAKRTVKETITGREQPTQVTVTRTEPLVVAPLYNDPEVVSDEELIAVLEKVLPRFTGADVKPNYIEHALRVWTIDAEFPAHPEAMSGEAMKTFLTDHGSYTQVWKEADPLLLPEPSGVAIRFGTSTGASIHHDHWLASLTEAGTPLDEPIYAPGRKTDFNGVLQEGLWGFRLDEAEIEWSAMAFGLWLPPQKEWMTKENRTISFDLIAEKLMTGDCRHGVCHGTHRVYSLMLLWRLDQEHDILSQEVQEKAYRHLEKIRDLITACQFEDGHWPSNWYDGAEALTTNVRDDEFYRKIIATGHHLEWLAIAPEELHPPREMILKAARYVIDDTTSRDVETIVDRYTFYSHVGNALALWRGTKADIAWREARSE